MGWVSGITVFMMIWWTTIFMVLPWGLKRDERGIPQNLHMKRKILIITGISVIVWLVICWMVEINFFDFRSMADLMMKQDYRP